MLKFKPQLFAKYTTPFLSLTNDKHTTLPQHFICFTANEELNAKCLCLLKEKLKTISSKFLDINCYGVTVPFVFYNRCINILPMESYLPNSMINHLLHYNNRVLCKIPNTDMKEIENNVGSILWNQLKSYQQSSVVFSKYATNCYIGDQMGTGKTLQALAISKYHNACCLIVCPSILRHTWLSQIKQWRPEVLMENIQLVSQGTESFLEKKFPKGTKSSFIIVSYALICNKMVREYITKAKLDCVIFDEAHYVKNSASQRSQAALSLSQEMSRSILLSGTPFNYSYELFAQIKCLAPFLYPTFHISNSCEAQQYAFANRYCKPQRVRIGYRVQWWYKGYTNQKELNAILGTFMIRRLKKDILSELPNKNRNFVQLGPMLPTQQAVIKKLLDASSDSSNSEIKQINQDKFSKAFSLTSQFKQKGVLEYLKAQCLSQLQNNSKTKMLLFFHHKRMRAALEEFFEFHKISFCSIHGETSSDKRKEFQDTFQTTDKYQIALLSIAAACTGLTLTAANYVVFCEILFGPDKMHQAEDRAHRIGQTKDVEIIYLVQPNSTDVINVQLIFKKTRETREILKNE